MSYFKKLNHFLVDAKDHSVIDQDTYDRLYAFANEQNSKTAASKIIASISFLGGVAVLLGLILIISHNWKEIPDLVKITVYLATLALMHVAGFMMRENCPRVSSSIHFIGAGYVLAGIGLVAQIFHLSNTQGTAYLIWFFLIVPLAFILNNKYIITLSATAFYTWLTINFFENYVDNWVSVLIYLMTASINLIMIPKILNSFEDALEHLTSVGYFILFLLIMLLGFSHDAHMSVDERYSIHPVTMMIMVANFTMMAFLSFKTELNTSKHDKMLFGIMAFCLVLPFLVVGLDPLLLSIIAWIIWFSIAALMIQDGIMQGNRSTINLGTWMFVLGLFVRFIDLVDTMRFTGSTFIIFGVILIALAIAGEKYRKHLISRISKQ